MDALADGLGGLNMTLEKPATELAAGNYSYFAEGDLLIAKVISARHWSSVKAIAPVCQKTTTVLPRSIRHSSSTS
jgi:hypothetical protein